MRTPDVIFDELPECERVVLDRQALQARDASAAHLADLKAHCDREYPDVEAEDPRDLLPFNWRARSHGRAPATVAHFRR